MLIKQKMVLTAEMRKCFKKQFKYDFEVRATLMKHIYKRLILYYQNIIYVMTYLLHLLFRRVLVERRKVFITDT